MERGDDPGEPAQAITLDALEAQISQLAEPTELLALATRIDELGMQLALELTGGAAEPARMAPLRPVLGRVPAVYARTLLRAAERFDDLGSPKRAAYVLLEALRKAFDPDTLATAADALSFLLDAQDQPAAGARVRALVTMRADRAGDQRPPGRDDRRELRARYVAALDELRAVIDWNALEDELGLD